MGRRDYDSWTGGDDDDDVQHHGPEADNVRCIFCGKHDHASVMTRFVLQIVGVVAKKFMYCDDCAAHLDQGG